MSPFVEAQGVEIIPIGNEVQSMVQLVKPWEQFGTLRHYADSIYIYTLNQK
jgi:hypothetical protein